MIYEEGSRQINDNFIIILNIVESEKCFCYDGINKCV